MNCWAVLGIRNAKDHRVFLQIKEERGHSSRSSSMVAHIQRKWEVSDGNHKEQQNWKGKGLKRKRSPPQGRECARGRRRRTGTV
jgi:hypothetical protein